MHCTNCGTRLNETAKFCHSCGAAVAAAQSAAAVGTDQVQEDTPGDQSMLQTIGDGVTIGVEGGADRGAEAELAAGDTFGGRYEIRRVLGRGGMGAVYEALDRTLDEAVALKVMLPSLAASDEAKHRFIREAKISRRLSHMNIVRVHDLLEVDGVPCISMEFVEGQSLRQTFELRKQARRPMPVSHIARLASSICDAMEYAHTLTVHRDLKPENILITRDHVVKITDFGIAALMDVSESRLTQGTLGTAYYMAPEQLAGGAIDASADVYSLGVILYEALTGRVPVGRFPNPSEVRDDVSPDLDELIMQALESRADRRPDSMRRLGDVLRTASGAAGTGRLTGLFFDPNEAEGAEEPPPVSRADARREEFPSVSSADKQAEPRSTTEGQQSRTETRQPILDPEPVKIEEPRPVVKPPEPAPARAPFPDVREDFERALSAIDTIGNSRSFTESVWRERLSVWEKAAEAGDRYGMWLLGDCYLEGVGKEKHYERAFGLFSRASVAGLTYADMTLGRLHYAGIHVAEDPAEAVRHWRRAADAGEASAKLALGRCHLTGNGLAKNASDAVALIEESSAGGLRQAKVILARCYENGKGVAKDTARALALFEEAAEAGNRQAMYHLGLALLQGTGVSADEASGLRWLEKAAELGQLDAVTHLEELGRPSRRELHTNSIGMSFVRISSGSFRMGSPDWNAPGYESYRDENPEHRVHITRPFFLAQHPVTQQQFQAVKGRNPSKFKKAFVGTNPRRPVERVSWWDAVTFCNELSKREGAEPYYRVDGQSVKVLGGDGYRLPTEAEWEYACRAGSGSFWFWGGNEEEAEDYAVCKMTSADKGTRDIGTKKGNRFGLFDMLGNVWEWCWDWFAGDYYGHSPSDDPAGPDSGERRVLRGGSWHTVPMNARSAVRDGNRPGEAYDDVGFRVARNAPNLADDPLPEGLR